MNADEMAAAHQVMRALLEAAHRGIRQRNAVDARAAEDIRDLWREARRAWGVEA